MKNKIFWGVFGILLFILYGYLGYASAEKDGIFNSPDETANAFFINAFRETGRLAVFEPLSEISDGTARPRSIAVKNGNLAPESFHGMPVIYGSLSRLLWPNSWLWFTALFAALAVLAWRAAVGSVFGARVGRYAAVLLALTPAWWYWSSRGLYHNSFFASLLIFAAYFLFSKPIQRRWNRPQFDFLISGLLLGFAAWVRTSELGWMFLILAILLFVFGRELKPRLVLGFFSGLVIALLPLLTFNQITYGHPFSAGYTLSAQTELKTEVGVMESASSFTDAAKGQIRFVKGLILPFGLNLRLAAENFMTHFVRLPAWISVIIVGSLVWLALGLLKEETSREETVLVLLFLAVTFWLVAVYGSWLIHDNPDPNRITIGTSYSRYWLPAWILASVVGALGLSALNEWFTPGMKAGLIFIFGTMAALSWNIVFNTPGDGLAAVANTLGEYSVIKKDVLLRVPSVGVIITDRADKLFFPDRKVMLGLREDSRMRVFERMSLRVPLYYYGITLTQDDLELQNQRFGKIGLRLRHEAAYTDSSLYRLSRVP